MNHLDIEIGKTLIILVYLKLPWFPACFVRAHSCLGMGTQSQYLMQCREQGAMLQNLAQLSIKWKRGLWVRVALPRVAALNYTIL